MKNKGQTSHVLFPLQPGLSSKAMVNRPVALSTNWKNLAPIIKKDKTTVPTVETAKPELWFEVDEQSLKRSEIESYAITNASSTKPISISQLFPEPANERRAKEVGKYIAMRCEAVGVGPMGRESALARISIVNYHGQVLLDRYVLPLEPITDYRTKLNGIEAHHLVNAQSLSQVQKEVWALLQGKVLIGHNLKHDFRLLYLDHPKRMTRDTFTYAPFCKLAPRKSPSLQELARQVLGVPIQQDTHDAIQDARIAMLLYRAHRQKWEGSLGGGKDHSKASRGKIQKRPS